MSKPSNEPPRLRRPEDGRCETDPITALLEDDSEDAQYTDAVERMRGRRHHPGNGPLRKHYSTAPAPMPEWLAKIGRKDAK